jgi:hypothetical protein
LPGDAIDGGSVVPSDLEVPGDGPVVLDEAVARKDGPCQATCKDLCELVITCGLYDKGPLQCLDDCAAWGAPLVSCLEGVFCSDGQASCQAAMSCILDPPAPDLVAKELVAVVKDKEVRYTFKVCNQGAAPAGPSVAALYYDRKAPPKPGEPGDQSKPVPKLQANQCAGMELKRADTPAGSFSSWVQADAKASVAETDEGNNVAGPVSVTVKAPDMPDLVVKQLGAKTSGIDIVYDVTVCNEGTKPSFGFRADIYYKRLLAPSPFMLGDASKVFWTGLAAGACSSFSRTYKNVSVGLYNSWAQVDTLNTVVESNEQNNVAGPQLTLVSAPSGCTSLCAFALGCGEFSITEFTQCLTWCKLMDTAQRTCADAAAQAVSCSQLQACSLPPKPPAPPPPWACYDICTYLINDCKLIASDQLITCLGGCITLPTTKIQCAMNAMNNKQCAAMALCIF